MNKLVTTDPVVINLGGLNIREDDLHFRKLGSELPLYQSSVRNAAYRYVRNWRSAIDIGGHIGIFSVDFARRFLMVHTFEPMPLNRICLEKNVPENVHIYPFGLGNREGITEMRYNLKNSGGSEVINPASVSDQVAREAINSGKIYVTIKRLDDFNICDVDLVKIDVQGMEEHVLLGSIKTLHESRPVVILEEKIVKTRPHDTTAIERARAVIDSYEYKLAEIVGNDAIYIPIEHPLSKA